ncbi:MAG: putative zinc-binding metallopeptidase [Deltaproteobacteria bacterium]|nr:putative zinc-binding metallopeptidase [Deltaproteobacteria bacterium]
MAQADSTFKEGAPELRGRDDLDVLERKISDLQLRIEGTRLGELVDQLHRELDAKGLPFKPRCYLSDEWGCPDGVPVIGIPFYLANPMLAKIEEEQTGDLEGEKQILMFLRHEAGHAYNYAYRLHETEEWHALFGPYTRPYVEDYKPSPFSKKFVKHIPGWYAQKHPDEDFAETFAVWLTPGSSWETAYKDWPALEKLRYVDRVTRALPPMRVADAVPPAVLLPVEEMSYTVREHYAQQEPEQVAEHVGAWLDGDLRDLFGGPEAGGEPAQKFIHRRRRDLARDVAYWTGARPRVIGALLDHLGARTGVLGLVVPTGREDAVGVRLAIMLTTLVVNHLYREKFVEV